MNSELAALALMLAVHLVAVCVLVWLICEGQAPDWRSWWPRDDEPGDEPFAPDPDAPRGDGLPLPGAVPAGVRLRTEHERLADPGRRRVRRPVHAPLPGRTRNPV